MRLTNLSDPVLLLEQHLNSSRTILRESCHGLTKEQQRIVEGIYKEFKPLIEASLTVDQIKQLFGEIEKQSIAGGQSRTLAGKGVDVAKKANEIINNVGKWLQDTAPVKAFDQKFEDLKAKVAEKFPDLAKQTAALGEWVKANPGKSAAVIGVLTALASLAGGPVGGAIAGQVLRGASELLKGEKLSTAIGKGIKTAALGYLSGKAFEVIGKYVAGMRADSIPFGPEDAGLEQVSYGATRTLTAPGLSSKETLQGFKVIAFPQEAEGINAAMNMIRNGEAGGFDALQRIAREIQSSEYKSALKDIMVNARADQLANDGLTQWINGMATAGQALSQGAAAAAGEKGDKKESYYTQARPLSEGQVYMLFDRVLTEAGFLDKVKTGAGKVAGAVGKGLDWAGRQATEKVTSAKLLAAWKLEGSPTDSEQLRKFLQDYGGVDTAIVDKVYSDMKLPVGRQEPQLDPAKAETIYAATKKTVANLNKKDKQRLIAYLNKQLGTA
jgi:hypothetical protein